MRHGWVRLWPIVLALALAVVGPAVSGAAAGSGAAWSAEELNWYGISQRRLNDTRADSGLPVLAADAYLWGLAHERARDMAQRGYLSHVTPEGQDAGAYMGKDGARYARWTELRADDTTGEAEVDVSWRVVSEFLNNAAAREAIVGEFDRLGVGLAEAAGRRVFVIMIARTAPPPPPTPVAPAPSASSGSIADIIITAANRHGVDPNRLLRVARCESGLNPRAYNPAGPYYGLFQFHLTTFKAFGGQDIYDPSDQSDVAARMFARGLASHWGCK